MKNVTALPFNTKLNIHKIRSYLEADEEEIIFKLLNPNFEFEKHINSDQFDSNLIKVFIELLSKGFSCYSLESQVYTLTQQLPESILFQSLYSYLKSNQQSYDHLKKLINILSYIIELHPEKVIFIKNILEEIKLQVIDHHNPEVLDEYNRKIVMPCLNLKASLKFKWIMITDFNELEHLRNVINTPVLPTLHEILYDQKQSLEPNITHSAYRSVNHYLSVQFWLYREDYIGPLRNGVNELNQIVKHESKKKRINLNDLKLNKDLIRKLKDINSVHVYCNVIMKFVQITRDGISYAFELDSSTKIDSSAAKRLIFGSLVCLSKDFFQNHCLIGTVLESGDKDGKNKKLVNVKFEREKNGTNLNMSDLPQFGEIYIMIETPAYFEPYKHVLNALKSFYKDGEINFPFKDYLIYSKSNQVTTPKYLRNEFINFGLIFYFILIFDYLN